MSKRQPGKSPSTDASAYSRRVVIADSAWTAQDRLRTSSEQALKTTGDVVGSPLERAAFFLRKRLIWPAEDRAAEMGRPARALATGAVVLAATAAGVAGLVWAAPDGPHRQTAVTRVTETSAPIAAANGTAPEEVEPTLHGAAPVFKPGHSQSVASEVDPAKAIIKSSPRPGSSSDAAAADSTASENASPAATTSSAARKGTRVDGRPAGPAALAVADEFAAAFLSYETGGTDAGVRRAFAVTTTPELAKALLKRPPRLPANVKVPKAKVLNVVAAPSNAGVFPISVSLLRVGVTSELRLQMEKLKGDGWRVTNVLG